MGASKGVNADAAVKLNRRLGFRIILWEVEDS